MSEITNNPAVPTQIVGSVKFPNFITNLGIIPTSYKDSMSYYECLAWLCKFLEETVLPTVNQNGQATEELQALYVELNSYVSNYFDNLDVQEEINNKLDDMVEDGTLQEIIAEYLNANAIWCFDSVSEMKSASNLINGSFAKTTGYYSNNDGGAAQYYIRTKTENDVIDYGSILQMDNENLVAVLINKFTINVKQFGAKGDGETDDTAKIQNAVNIGTSIFIPDGSYLITEAIYLKSNKNIKGSNNSSIISNEETICFTNNRTENVTNIVFDSLNFIGNCINDPDITHYPKRERTLKNESYNGLTSAVVMKGTLYKRETIGFSCENITVKNCNIYDTYGLPVNFLGIKNLKYINNTIVNCMDSGFVDCENLLIDNNFVEKSADNGLSISSGCNNVICTNNIINYSAIAGIWCSGWKVDEVMYYGPKNVTIANNVIKNSGRSGVLAKWVVENITIDNNLIDTCLLNYKDLTTDNADGGAGVMVMGWSGTTLYQGETISVTEFSKNITISNNKILNCVRDGIYGERLKNLEILNNNFTNCGAKKHQDGTTDIATSETKYRNLIYLANFDITIDSKTSIIGNTYNDTRDDANSFDYIYNKYVFSQYLNVFVKNNLFFVYDDSKVYTYGNITDSLKFDDILTDKKATGFIALPDTITTVQGLYDYFHSDNLFEYKYQNTYFIRLSNTLLGNLVGFSGSSGFGCVYRFNNNLLMLSIFLPTSGLIYTCRINQGTVDNVHKYTGTSVTIE